MKLAKEDSDLFFKLMLPLLLHVNRKLELLPDIQTMKQFEGVGFQDKSVIRDALYENINLIDSFIDENPEDLPMKDLAIVSGWKNFVSDDFFIERFLKKYAVFIGTNDKVYGVLSLRDSLDELVPAYALPLRVQTVLLPFRDEIIYDGFIAPYRISFGSGITGDLKRLYLKAKKREEIIVSFNPDLAAAKSKDPKKPIKDWKPEIKELIEKAAKLRGGTGQSELLSPAFSLVKASLELADLVTEKKLSQEAIYKCLSKIERQANKLEEELYYFED
jgi:hypothetical protein